MKKPDNSTLLSWCESDLPALGRYLVSGSVHGKPGLPVAELERLKKIIAGNLDEKALFSLAVNLAARKEYSARSLACQFLASGWPLQKMQVEKLTLKLANDEDWIVRESAAGLFARLLEEDFASFSKKFLGWLKSGTVNTKRAMALAIKYDSKSQRSERWPFYEKITLALMAEADEYIRKNLGPFAIGDGLLPRFPQPTLRLLRKAVKKTDEHTRWNVAMVFSSAHSRAYSKEGHAILSLLKEDDRRSVQRSIAVALRNLSKATA